MVKLVGKIFDVGADCWRD